MKLPFRYIKIAVVLFVPTVVYVGCTTDANFAGGTSETTSANITGKIWNDDGTEARGAVVKLMPADFNPYAVSDGDTIDSVYTDANGNYSFMIKSAGFFNVNVQSGKKYCFEDSVCSSEEKHVIVKDDTLREPASISGCVQLQPGDDNRQIIILVLGTNTYTSPTDLSGNFSIPVLAEGRYILRFLTAKNGYGILDTAVTVKSGDVCVIPGILHVPFVNLPEFGPIAARFDSTRMYAIISWPACDTSAIAGFYVFRNTGITTTPLAIMSSTDTSFVDDVVLLDPGLLPYGDTLRYTVASVSKNRSLNKVGNAPYIRFRSFLTPIDTIPFPHSDSGLLELSINRDHNIYKCDWGSIMKFDSAGHLMAIYDKDPGAYFTSVVTDKNGNVYTYQSSHGRLMKFSPELQPSIIKTIQDPPSEGYYEITIDHLENIHLFLAYEFQKTFIKTFDATLSVLRSDSIPEFCGRAQMHDDTVFFSRGNRVNNVIAAYDIWGNFVREQDVTNILRNYSPVSTYESFIVITAPIIQVNYSRENVSLIWLGGILLAVDGNNDVVGRCNLSGDSSDNCVKYAFDGVDRIYLFNKPKQSIYIYKLN